MTAPEDVDQWITDSREAGLPVLVLATVLVVMVVGIPLAVAAGPVLTVMFLAQLVAAKRLFPPCEPD